MQQLKNKWNNNIDTCKNADWI